MLQLILRRLLLSIPVLLFLTLLLFLALKLIPGDAALVMAGERATAEHVDYIRRSLNLDRPWYIQYGLYLWNLVTNLDLGRSLFHDRPILELLQSTVPATLELGFFALFIAVPVGVVLGALGAVYRNKWIDRATAVYSLAGVSMPIFWLALVLMYVFSIVLGWLPTSGRIGDEVLFDPSLDSITKMYTLDGLLIWLKSGDASVLLAALKHICLPAFALSTIPMAQICRMSRSSFLEVLNQDYIRTARAKGVSPAVVLFKHAFRNASLQIVTVSMLQAGVVFGGAVITETMFAWPGLGKVLVESIASRDFPMVQSGTLFVGCVFVLFNLMADVFFVLLDPRVKRNVAA